MSSALEGARWTEVVPALPTSSMTIRRSLKQTPLIPTLWMVAATQRMTSASYPRRDNRTHRICSCGTWTAVAEHAICRTYWSNNNSRLFSHPFATRQKWWEVINLSSWDLSRTCRVLPTLLDPWCQSRLLINNWRVRPSPTSGSGKTASKPRMSAKSLFLPRLQFSSNRSKLNCNCKRNTVRGW